MPSNARKSAPSTLQIVAGILVAVIVAILLIVAGFWMWDESFVYRGNGTMYPNP